MASFFRFSEKIEKNFPSECLIGMFLYLLSLNVRRKIFRIIMHAQKGCDVLVKEFNFQYFFKIILHLSDVLMFLMFWRQVEWKCHIRILISEKKNSLLPKNDVRNIKMSDYRNFNISVEVFMHWSFLCKPNIIIVFFWMNNLLILIMSGTGNSIAEVITNRKLLASYADILLMHKIKCSNEVLINWQIFLHYIQQLCSKFCPSKNFVRGYCIFIKITSR